MNSSAYQKAGVNIDAGNQFVDQIKPLIKKTYRSEVLSSIGGYAGLFALNTLKYTEPVLVSTTDGVGTKLKLALEQKRYKGLGQDLVGMCVNDLLCVGAEPLFFLDYFATGKLDLKIATQVVDGITESLKAINCTLLGGETAEMPGFYANQDFDLAGFAVGMVNRDEIIDGSTISVGDQIVGLASSGPHANGFSLIRKIIQDEHLDLTKVYPPLTIPLVDLLLEPTRIYVNNILAIKRQIPLKGIAHITGGGLIENPPRIFPKSCRAVLQKSSWKQAPIFSMLQKWGQISDEEMLRVFNCGIGLIVVVAPEHATELVQRLKNIGEDAYLIGEIFERESEDQAAIRFE